MTVSRFALPEHVDFNNFMDVRTSGERHIDAHPESEFDLSDLVDASSVAVALLVAWFRYAHVHDRTIGFSHVSAALNNLIEVTELAEILPLQDDS